MAPWAPPTRDKTAPPSGNHQADAVGATRLFEPPEGRVLSAIGRHLALVGVCALLFAGIGIAAGLLRTPVYTASATLQVGQVNPNSPGFLGYEQSASSLATAFSRAIAADPVLTAVEAETGASRGRVTSRLSSEPIPLSPAFRVIATGSSAAAATRLANSAAKAVVAYESKSNSADPEATAQLSEYRKASEALHKAESDVAKLEEGHAGARARLAAEAEVSAARVHRQAVGNAYVATVATQAPRKGLVTILAGATSAEDDRKSKTELLGFIGLLVGAAIGCALAVARELRRERRRDTVPAAA
jgi:hypothetical protein